MMVGLMAGNSLAFVLGMGNAIENLSVGSYIELYQSMDTALTVWTPMFYVIVTGLMAASLWVLRKEWKSVEFMLVAFALICVLDELAMTWSGNLPLNRLIHSWQSISPPSNWSEVRSQWLRFMYIRSALLISGFGLLLASSFFMKRTLPSRRDAFAVV